MTDSTDETLWIQVSPEGRKATEQEVQQVSENIKETFPDRQVVVITGSVETMDRDDVEAMVDELNRTLRRGSIGASSASVNDDYYDEE